MTLKEYQEFTRTTAIYPKSLAIPYLCMGLGGECGETLDKVKKVYRDYDGVFLKSHRAAIKSELSDVCWYITRLSDELGFTLEEVIEENICKLSKRKDEGKISGSGDNR